MESVCPMDLFIRRPETCVCVCVRLSLFPSFIFSLFILLGYVALADVAHMVQVCAHVCVFVCVCLCVCVCAWKRMCISLGLFLCMLTIEVSTD